MKDRRVEMKMKTKRKEKLVKSFLALFLCVCFIGLPETSQASEQEDTKLCDGGDLDGCNRLGDLEKQRGNLDEALGIYKESCDLGSTNGCRDLGFLEKLRGNFDGAAVSYKKACDGGDFYACADLIGLAQERGDYKEFGSLYRKVSK